MTNPVILLGTQSNGETLPVQVDATGRLVAEGLQGSKGDQGEQGPPGADGGSFPLPPDPYEGALLGWLDGGLAWIGTPPVPIPDTLFGPITAWDSVNNVVTVEGSIPDYVGTGVYLDQSDQYGNPTGSDSSWLVTKDWSLCVDLGSSILQSPASSAFQTTQDSPTMCSGSWQLTGLGIADASEVKVALSHNSSDNLRASASINGQYPLEIQGSNYHMRDNPLVFKISGPVDSIQVNKITTNTIGIYSIWVDGKRLVDNSIGGVPVRVNNVIGSNQLLVIPLNGYGLRVGEYLYSKAQRVAPWVLYGNDPTSLIDHLRQRRD